MSKHVRVELNRLNLRRFSNRLSMDKVDKVTKEVEALAKLAARGPYSTGHLARTIYRVTYTRGNNAIGEVRSNDPKSEMIHGGTRPHPIHPIRPDGTMVFFWRKVGRVVYFKRPHIRMHPGSAPKRFLSGPMERVGRRNGFIVLTFGE